MIASVLGKQHAVHGTGQIDVRKERANAIRILLKHLNRVVPVGGVKNGETRLFECVNENSANERLVFDHEHD